MARQEKKTQRTGFHTPFADLKRLRPLTPAPARAPAPPPPPPRPEASSDADVFLAEMGGVQPLTPDPRGRTKAPPPTPAPRARDDDAEAYAQLCDLVQGEGPFDIADTPEYIEGIAHGLDRRLLRRLRRGDYAVQGHVDLHGLTTEAARDVVERFIDEARTAGKRCVLIIHGRGLNSKDHIPVLKERLRLWLTRGRIGRSVLCFATAQPYDGGAGAIYVLLRR
jgi:DNA-nicking Smr family endonuclease